jgi:hypothetical protein
VPKRCRQRDLISGDRSDSQLFILRFVVRTTFVVAQLSRVGNNDVIAWQPAGQRLIEFEIRLTFKRFSRQASERRSFYRTMHADLA